MIFVEARQSAAVTAAMTGIVGVFLIRGINLVPIEEMAPLLKIKKRDINHTGERFSVKEGGDVDGVGRVLFLKDFSEHRGDNVGFSTGLRVRSRSMHLDTEGWPRRGTMRIAMPSLNDS
jgi:hypothetical protein